MGANSRGATKTRSNRRNANVQEPANSFDAPTPYGKHLLVHRVGARFRRIFRSLRGQCHICYIFCGLPRQSRLDLDSYVSFLHSSRSWFMWFESFLRSLFYGSVTIVFRLITTSIYIHIIWTYIFVSSREKIFFIFVYRRLGNYNF